MSSPDQEPATDRQTQVRTNKENEYGPFNQKFPTERLHVRNPANTASQKVAGHTITSDREVTMPQVDADCALAYRDGTTGLVTTDQLGTGTPDNTKFLRGDSVWAVPAGGGGGGSGVAVYVDGVQVGTVARDLDFTGSHFDIVEDSVNNQFDVDLDATLVAALVRNDQNNDLGAHYFDMTRQAAPANPSANAGRFYVKQIDANNDGVFVKIKRGGSFVEVQIV